MVTLLIVLLWAGIAGTLVSGLWLMAMFISYLYGDPNFPGNLSILVTVFLASLVITLGVISITMGD